MASPFSSNYTTFAADITIDGETLSNIGIRKKGFIGSQSTEKPSLKINLDEYEESAFSRNPSTSIELTANNDIALLKRRENFQTVYLHYSMEKLNAIILPVRGYGLWGTMKGYLALQPDLKTIIGLEFFDHK